MYHSPSLRNEVICEPTNPPMEQNQDRQWNRTRTLDGMASRTLLLSQIPCLCSFNTKNQDTSLIRTLPSVPRVSGLERRYFSQYVYSSLFFLPLRDEESLHHLSPFSSHASSLSPSASPSSSPSLTPRSSK